MWKKWNRVGGRQRKERERERERGGQEGVMYSEVWNMNGWTTEQKKWEEWIWDVHVIISPGCIKARLQEIFGRLTIEWISMWRFDTCLPWICGLAIHWNTRYILCLKFRQSALNVSQSELCQVVDFASGVQFRKKVDVNSLYRQD